MIFFQKKGGEFIGRTRTLRLIGELKQDYSKIHDLLSESLLTFSEIIPILAWSHKETFFLENIRKRINRSLQKFMHLLRGFAYRHSDLEGFLSGFSLEDEFNLSMIVLDIFNMIGLRRFGGGPGH